MKFLFCSSFFAAYFSTHRQTVVENAANNSLQPPRISSSFSDPGSTDVESTGQSGSGSARLCGCSADFGE